MGQLPIVDPGPIELVGEWTQLNNSDRKVLPGIRPIEYGAEMRPDL